MNSSFFEEITIVICSFFSHEKLSKFVSAIDKRFKILIIEEPNISYPFPLFNLPAKHIIFSFFVNIQNFIMRQPVIYF